MIKSNWKICLLDFPSVIIEINQLRRKNRDCQRFEENSWSQIESSWKDDAGRSERIIYVMFDFERMTERKNQRFDLQKSLATWPLRWICLETDKRLRRTACQVFQLWSCGGTADPSRSVRRSHLLQEHDCRIYTKFSMIKSLRALMDMRFPYTNFTPIDTKNVPKCGANASGYVGFRGLQQW